MTKNEMGYVVAFLRDLLDRYGNDGCNDLKMPDTPENRALIAAAEKMDVSNIKPWKGELCTYNHVILGHLTDKMMKAHGLTEADVPSL